MIVASQGGPKAHIRRFKDAGVTWLHVAASPEHAKKAEDAGVDAVIVIGSEAGGHPPLDEVGTLVVVRAAVRAVRLPVIAGGGVVDGAGIAALLALGAEGVQLGTRFLLTPEAYVHAAYKQRALELGISDTRFVGRGGVPVRMAANAFAQAYLQAERGGAGAEELKVLFDSRTLKMAALDGEVDWGKLEVGQGVGMVDALEPAGELVGRLVRETVEALRAGHAKIA